MFQFWLYCTLSVAFCFHTFSISIIHLFFFLIFVFLSSSRSYAYGDVSACKALLSDSGHASTLKYAASYRHLLKPSEIGLNQRWIATRLLQEAPEVNTGSAKSIFTAPEAVISTGQAMWGHDLTCVILWSQFLCCLGLAYCATVNPCELCRMVCNHHGCPPLPPLGIFRHNAIQKLCIRILCYRCLWDVTNVFAQWRCNGMNINYGQSDLSNLSAWKSVSRFDLKSKLELCVYLVLQIVDDEYSLCPHDCKFHALLSCVLARQLICSVCWHEVFKCM